ncbi:M6 family metalloprotease domain-containing protein [Trichlorobacter lovleyi]|uniref:M6 family metalloprotease domain-containing protein n=1 Tax=Trichlorobacter lovleyi TaxID=313985 RepID=UPI003D131D58
MPQQKAPADLPKRLKPQRNTEAEKLLSEHIRNTYQQRLNQASATPSSGISAGTGNWVPVPVSGNRNLLIVLVNFADRTMTTTTPASWSAKIFDTTAGAKSVAKYFKDNSFSTLNVLPATHTQSATPGVVSVTVADNHPNSGNSYDYTSETTILNHALAQAASYVNFASFDTNNNGTLEQSELSIYFIYAGYEDSGSDKTPKIWAHAWGGYDVLASGKYVTRWAINGELNNSDVQHPMGVIAHELGHALCGLPDLYDTSYSNGGMGHFSLMAGGSWGADIGEYSGVTPTALDAWTREYLGWATPVTPTSSGNLSLAHPLSSQNAVYKFVSPLISSTEYFLVENRQPTGWDLGLRSYLGSGWLGGLLITHIDITSGSVGGNDINDYETNNVAGGGHQGVVPVQASTANCNMLTTTSRGCSTTLYYSSNNASWGPVTTPNSNYYSGTATNFSLTGISAQAATMTGSISFIPPLTKTLTVSKGSTGSGTVSSSPAGISCGSTCSASFLQNETVTLTAAADAGSIFTGWSGGGCSGTGTCVVSLANDTTVTASFATATTLISENFDSVTAPSIPSFWSTNIVTGSYNWATSTDAVTPHSGANALYYNSYWAPSGSAAALISPSFSLATTTNNTISFWMYRDTNGSSYADRVEIYVNNSNSLTNATLLGTVNRATALAPAVNSYGWYNYSFTIPESFNSATNFLIIKSISAYGYNIYIDDISVTGIPLLQYTLTVNHAYTAAGAIKGGGSINGSGISCSAVNGGSKTGTCSVSLDDGSTVTLAAAADANSTFNGWTGGGCSGTDGCSFTIASDTTVTGTFAGAYKTKISGGNGYDTLTLAHGNAADNATILARELHNATSLAAEPFTENLTVTKPITLKGGYNAAFSSNAGLYSTLAGILTIGGTSGSLTVENLIIK